MAAMFTLTKQKCLSYSEGSSSNKSKYIKFSTKEDTKKDVWECTIWDEPQTAYLYSVAKKILRVGDYYNLTGTMQRGIRMSVVGTQEVPMPVLYLKVQTLELAQEMKEKKESNPPQPQKLTGGFGM